MSTQSNHISGWVRKFTCYLLAVALIAVVPAAHVQPIVSFRNQTIKLIVPFEAGGGTDAWARFWAPLIAAKIPGNPNIEVVNVPGAGATRGANQFAQEAGTDGLVMMASSASVVFADLLNDPRVKYDVKDWLPLLASPTGGVVYADPAVLAQGADPLAHGKSVPWKMQIQGPTQLGMIMMLSLELLGFDFKASFGAGGGMDTFEAFRNGVVNIDMQTTSSYRTNVTTLVDNNNAVPLFAFGAIEPEKLVPEFTLTPKDKNKILRDPSFPKIPTLIEVYQRLNPDAETASPAFTVWQRFFLAGFPAQKMLVIPKDTDPRVIETLNNAMKRVVKEMEPLQRNKEEILGSYEQYVGEAAHQLLEQAADLDPEALQWYQDWVKEKFGIDL